MKSSHLPNGSSGDSSIEDDFIARSRYYLREEYLPKIRLAVASLPEEAMWWRANASSNSIGNLILHLAGNARQWIVAGVGGAPDDRVRQAEFDRDGGLSRDELVAHLTAALRDIDEALSRVSMEDLKERRTIQGADTTVFEAIYHVVEHFSMHTGQIILLAKSLAPGGVQFYEATERAFRPLWTSDAD